MTNNASNDRIDAFIHQTSALISGWLTSKQQEIEEETGEKLSLEEIFRLYRNVILGKEPEEDVVLPGRYPRIFPEGLPGFRFDHDWGYFLPDIPTLWALHNWHRPFFPRTQYAQEEAEILTRLYLEPKFQRIASSLRDRLLLIAHAEGMSTMDFSKSIGEEELNVVHYLGDSFSYTPFEQSLMDKIVKHYGEDYGEAWIRQNSLPLGKAFLHDDFTSGRIPIEVWWKPVAELLAHEENAPMLAHYPAETANRKLRWLYNQPKFKSLSKTLAGRLDLICALECKVPEDIAEDLQIDLNVLKQTEENHDLIVEQLILQYRNEYGAAWLAFGMEALGSRFAGLAITDTMRFLRRVPALFRNNNRYSNVRLAPQSDTLEGTEPKGRCCAVCEQPIEGRVDKRFCSKRCQRSFYRNAVKQQMLEETEAEEESDESEPQENQTSEKKPEGFAGIFGETLGGYVNAAAGMLLERGVDYVAGRMFGEKK